jgi:hypothetical protein
VYGGLKDEDRIFTNLYACRRAVTVTRIKHLNFPQLLHFRCSASTYHAAPSAEQPEGTCFAKTLLQKIARDLFDF